MFPHRWFPHTCHKRPWATALTISHYFAVFVFFQQVLLLSVDHNSSIPSDHGQLECNKSERGSWTSSERVCTFCRPSGLFLFLKISQYSHTPLVVPSSKLVSSVTMFRPPHTYTAAAQSTWKSRIRNSLFPLVWLWKTYFPCPMGRLHAGRRQDTLKIWTLILL